MKDISLSLSFSLSFPPSLSLQLLLLQVVALKQDSDLVDLFLSLHDTSGVVVAGPVALSPALSGKRVHPGCRRSI